MKFSVLSFLLISSASFGQNPLMIPPTIETSTISLTLQEGTTQFFPGVTTNTMGANGALLGPTLIMNQGDNVSITVDNQLSDTTTVHWHGMHVPAEMDGSPHNIILPGATWNPQFTVLDKAGLNWYHPHLHMKTDQHVSKGIAGLIFIRDAEEAALNIPMTYGVDEIPLVLQTKGFDGAGQILVHTESDDTPMANGTVDAFTTLPAQVIRLRILNGATQRVMELGFSDNRSFHIIGTDGGLFPAPVTKTRYRIAPGQRVDILVDLTTSLGQNLQLMSFASELPNAHYGAAQPGMGPGLTGTLVGYTSNPLNGNDYAFLDITVGAATPSPITSIPTSLVSFTDIPEASANITRTLTFMSMTMGNLNGPFMINGAMFDMSVINYTIPLDNVEIWSLTNQTPIAHPFHIHDVQFQILDINGAPPPAELQGWNDVVLVPGGMGNVRFIAKFSDHADDMYPYMYHCHMLTHEDGGMMGQFLVTAENSSLSEVADEAFSLYPNPVENQLTLEFKEAGERHIRITDVGGREVFGSTTQSLKTVVDVSKFATGVYLVHSTLGDTLSSVRFVKQ